MASKKDRKRKKVQSQEKFLPWKEKKKKIFQILTQKGDNDKRIKCGPLREGEIKDLNFDTENNILNIILHKGLWLVLHRRTELFQSKVKIDTFFERPVVIMLSYFDHSFDRYRQMKIIL